MRFLIRTYLRIGTNSVSQLSVVQWVIQWVIQCVYKVEVSRLVECKETNQFADIQCRWLFKCTGVHSSLYTVDCTGVHAAIEISACFELWTYLNCDSNLSSQLPFPISHQHSISTAQNSNNWLVPLNTPQYNTTEQSSIGRLSIHNDGILKYNTNT